MSYTPAIPLDGLAGWRFLQRSQDVQKQHFQQSAVREREIDYFRDNISKVKTGADLVGDYRLLKVALGAFGLDDDIQNKYFIQKILDEGTSADDALANRFTDDRYGAFSAAFGFGPGETPQTDSLGFSDKIEARFTTRSFEIAVGDENESYRVALSAERELTAFAISGQSEEATWYNILAQPPLRQFFETTFGLPSAFGQLDLERQIDTLRDLSQSRFGSGNPQTLVNEGKLSEMIDQYLVRAQIDGGLDSQSPAGIALALLGG